jgi:hypothetical protein
MRDAEIPREAATISGAIPLPNSESARDSVDVVVEADIIGGGLSMIQIIVIL